MSLPAELLAGDKKRDYEQLAAYANHIQGTITENDFLGEDFRSLIATITRLAESLDMYSKKYSKDLVVPGGPPFGGIKNSQLKIHRRDKQLNGAG